MNIQKKIIEIYKKREEAYKVLLKCDCELDLILIKLYERKRSKKTN